MSSPWLWFVSRAGGVVSLVLLTVVVVAGAVTAADRPLPTAMAGWVAGLHRYLTLGVLGLLTIHIGAAVIDTYVDLAWSAVIVPFTGGIGRPGWGGVRSPSMRSGWSPSPPGCARGSRAEGGMPCTGWPTWWR